MFGTKPRGTVIAKGLKIVGSVTAEGLVEINGQIDGELHCTSLVIASGAHVNGTVAAERVVVDGNFDGPIQAKEVLLKSQAHVVGDIHRRICCHVPRSGDRLVWSGSGCGAYWRGCRRGAHIVGLGVN